MFSALKLLICVGLVLTTAASTKERRKRTVVELANPLAAPWQYQNNWQLQPTSNGGVPLYDILRVNTYGQNGAVTPDGQVLPLNMYYNMAQQIPQNLIPNVQQQGYIYPGEYRTINVGSQSNLQERPLDAQSQQIQPDITGDYRGVQDYQKLVGSINRYSLLSSYLNGQYNGGNNAQIQNQPIQQGNLNAQNFLGYNPLIKNDQGLIDEGRLSGRVNEFNPQLLNNDRYKQIPQGNIQQGDVEQQFRANEGLNANFGRYTQVQQGNTQEGTVEQQLRANAGLKSDFGRYTQVQQGNTQEGNVEQQLRANAGLKSDFGRYTQVQQGNIQQGNVEQQLRGNVGLNTDFGRYTQIPNVRQKNEIEGLLGNSNNGLNSQLLRSDSSKQVPRGNNQQEDINEEQFRIDAGLIPDDGSSNQVLSGRQKNIYQVRPSVQNSLNTQLLSNERSKQILQGNTQQRDINNNSQLRINTGSNLGLRYNKQVSTGTLSNGGDAQETAQASRERIIEQIRLSQAQGNQGKLLGERAQQQLGSNQDRQQAIQSSLKETQADSGAALNAEQPQGQALGQGQYRYSELSGKILNVLKSNPSMTSNFGDLVDQLLNGSGNPQIKLLKNLLQEIGKYAVGAEGTTQSSQQQGVQNPLVKNLLEVMNRSGINQKSLVSKGGRWRY